MVGTAVGALGGFKIGVEAYGDFHAASIATGAFVGFATGCLIGLVDRPTRLVEAESGNSTVLCRPAEEDAPVISRCLAILAAICSLMPIVGIGMAGISLIVNWNRPDWCGLVSRVATVVSCVVTALFIVAVLMGA